MEREIKFYVNARDLEILKLALLAHCKKVSKLEHCEQSLGVVGPITELSDYMDGLLTCVKNLSSHYPFKKEQQ